MVIERVLQEKTWILQEMAEITSTVSRDEEDLMKMTTFFSLNYQEIRSLIVQGEEQNISIKGDQGYLRGKNLIKNQP